ncbi:MAG: hypothetical protein HY332_14775 [Chloroflexi bacterium]|nr:hypothetical protein [Chloroflexota bacterium]
MRDQPSRTPDLRPIREGSTEFLVPHVPSSRATRGPGSARDGLFFNPASAFARDLSVLYLAAVVRPGMRVLDGLTGVGARAARWQREVPGEIPFAACEVCGWPAHFAGPLWTGCLWDPDLLRRLLLLADDRPLATGSEVRAALAGWLAEAAAPPLFYDLHAAAAHCGAVAMPPLETVRQRLAVFGHLAVRTHFPRTGIKTDAGARQVLDLLQHGEHHAGGDVGGAAPRTE